MGGEESTVFLKLAFACLSLPPPLYLVRWWIVAASGMASGEISFIFFSLFFLIVDGMNGWVGGWMDGVAFFYLVVCVVSLVVFVCVFKLLLTTTFYPMLFCCCFFLCFTSCLPWRQTLLFLSSPLLLSLKDVSISVCVLVVRLVGLALIDVLVRCCVRPDWGLVFVGDVTCHLSLFVSAVCDMYRGVLKLIHSGVLVYTRDSQATQDH